MLRPIVTKGVPKVVPKVFAIHARSWVALFRGSPRGFSRGVPKAVTKDFAPKNGPWLQPQAFFFWSQLWSQAWAPVLETLVTRRTLSARGLSVAGPLPLQAPWPVEAFYVRRKWPSGGGAVFLR